MTRPIKFRAWDNTDEKMRLDIGVYDGHILTYSTEHDLYSELSKKRYISMQFTGLLDKNGKEIYEGDIVQTDNTLPPNDARRYHSMQVKSCDGAFVIEDMGKKYNVGDYEWCHIKVIGNTHENPELLK